MARKLTPWERLDGAKHSLNLTNVALDSIIEDAVEWERSRIIKLLEDRRFWLIHKDLLAEADELKTQIALINGEK